MISQNLLPGRLFEAIRVTNLMKSLGPSGLVVVDVDVDVDVDFDDDVTVVVAAAILVLVVRPSWAISGHLGPSWAVFGPSWSHLGHPGVVMKTCKNQWFSTLLERRCSKTIVFSMVFQHFCLNDVLAFLGPSWDRLGSQLPSAKASLSRLV